MLGYGLGLRTKHYEYVLAKKPKVDWFEIISENYMVPGGRPRRILREVLENYPVILHGVSLSLGSTGPLNKTYLSELKALADEVQPKWFSDHLCWTWRGGHYSHDLLPLPYNREALSHVCKRISLVQDYVNREFLVENVSSYVAFKQSDMPEWEFLAEVTRRTGCKLLLDINNIYVSSRNHGFKAEDYLHGIPRGAVKQFHMAGHLDLGTHVIDTHDHPVRDEVWDLYAAACKRFGPQATMIERDDNIPEFPELYRELMTAKKIQEKTTHEKTSDPRRNSRKILEKPAHP